MGYDIICSNSVDDVSSGIGRYYMVDLVGNKNGRLKFASDQSCITHGGQPIAGRFSCGAAQLAVKGGRK
jgi:hypothetical protein